MVRIRRATRADAAAVAAVHEQARIAYYRPAGYEPDSSDRFDLWDRYIGAGEVEVVCAENEGQVVGFLATRVTGDTDPDPCLELLALYVLPKRWAAGIGSALYGWYVRQLQASGVARGVLEVWDRNDRAKRFYRHRGWEPDGRVRPGPLDCPFITMQLDKPAVRSA